MKNESYLFYAEDTGEPRLRAGIFHFIKQADSLLSSDCGCRQGCQIALHADVPSYVLLRVSDIVVVRMDFYHQHLVQLLVRVCWKLFGVHDPI